ncbi:MAG: hypothetical protein J5884_03755 [Paludibacteraceae bacterium]|nr:hypothetical protein [Paludibacteraceae bacterium]
MRKILLVIGLFSCLSLAAQVTDSVLFAAYQKEDMKVWKEYIESQTSLSPLTSHLSPLLYEYGYCGYIVAEAKKEGNEALLPEAKRCVEHFKSQISNFKSQMSIGHYEMYMSAVYVFELRLHESIHPVKSMSLAKEATKLAPNDPLVLSYYGTCLFYAPKPFGSKSEALEWFEKAKPYFSDGRYKFCWIREANEMYIRQCKEKLKMH